MKAGFLKGAKTKKNGLLQVAVMVPAAIADTDLNLCARVLRHGYCLAPYGPAFCTIPRDAAPGDPKTESFLPLTTLASLAAIPGFPRALDPPKDTPFRLAPSPGKGLGLFATRDIKQGELLYDKRPLVATSQVQINHARFITAQERGVLESRAKADCIMALVARLGPEAQATVMALHNDSPSLTMATNLHGIYETNAASIKEIDGDGPMDGNVSGLCEHISRLNHSCSPNTQRQFIPESFSWRVYAVRDVTAGEELTMPYVDCLLPATERRVGLAQYGFTCTCPACTDAPASDPRRAVIKANTTTTIAPLLNSESPADTNTSLVEKGLEQLRLLEAENLQAMPAYWETLVALMRLYAALGDGQTAQMWEMRAKGCGWYSKKWKTAEAVEPLLPCEEPTMASESN
ncbi:SET domain-containing protein [Mycena kentingensis (nom. inval.)]|nr:SET domain-containing protein [Mycena kentingensis (nom. inval.)]